MAVQIIDNTPIDNPISFENRTRYRLFPLKQSCPPCPVIQCTTCCPNDLGGNYLVGEGDLIYLQFYTPDTFNEDPENPAFGWKTSGTAPGEYWLELLLYDHNSNPIALDGIDDIAIAWSASSIDGQSVQNVVIPASYFIENGITCFYFCVRALGIRWAEYIVVDHVGPTQPEDPFYGMVFLDSNNGAYIYTYTLLNNGTEGWIQNYQPPVGSIIYDSGSGTWWQIFTEGETQEASQIERPELIENPTDGVSLCCTRLYELASCKDTVQVCTDREDGRDCLGRIYDRPPNGIGVGDSSYRLCRRLPGSVEAVGYPHDRVETDEGVIISSGYSEQARMRLGGLCRYDAEELAAMLANEFFTVEGEAYDSASPVEKNNDNGSHWWPDITLTREICDATDDCDFEFE